MYNPYASSSGVGYGQGNLEHPQPQHLSHQQPHSLVSYGQHDYQQSFNHGKYYDPQQQYLSPNHQQFQQGNHQQYQSPPYDQPSMSHTQLTQFQQHTQRSVPQDNTYGGFFLDPAASMAAQFAKNSLGLSNQYIQRNFGLYIPMAGEISYYFKISNSYVWRKILLILFPYRHRDWSRMMSSENTAQASASHGGVSYSPAFEDVNAPDLYIPLMSFVTYILLWALFLGLRGDFHPEVFGYLASQTLACSFVDIALFKVGLYLLNCSTHSSLWDLVAFSGYKYVPITILLCAKQLFRNSWVAFLVFSLAIVANLSVFLMRSLKFMVLPLGLGDSSVSISNNKRRIRVQFLFLYSVVFQFMIVLFMSR